MTLPPDFDQPRPPFLEYGPESGEFLVPGQNIVDQTPFDDIPQSIGIEQDFFTGKPILGLGSLVRTALIEEINWGIMLKEHTLARLKTHVSTQYWNKDIEHYRTSTLAFIRSFPHAEAYFQSYWVHVVDLFDLDGQPKPHQNSSRKQPVIPLTFAAFQASRRGDRYLGLDSALPGLSSFENLRDGVGMGKRKVNRKFKVYRSLS